MKSRLKQWICLFLLSGAVAASAQIHTIEVKKNNEVVFSTPVSSIDYIDIITRLDTPQNVNAFRENNQIKITWKSVANSTSYSVFRSADSVNFAEIGTSETTSYIDKSPLPNANYYKVVANGDDGMASSASAVTNPVIFDGSLASGIYLGVVGFNQQLYKYPISFLGEESRDAYFSFVDNLELKNGTLLYYCADQSITGLQEAGYPADLSNVAMVTFTDGLDQGSFMMDTSYADDEEFLEGINGRINNGKVSGVPITAYSVGLRGTDVVDSEKFKLNLQKLASTPEYAMEVSNMDEVKEKFKEIAQQLVETNSVHAVTLNMPGLANGTRVRFTFDNVTDATNSDLYIEGSFSLADFTLKDAVYHGMSCESGSVVSGEKNGIFVKFTFNGVRTDSKKPLPFDYLKEWTFITSTSSWQPNSEFNKDEGSAIETTYRSAAIMLNLDCSSSLGSVDFKNVKENAKSFIATLLQQNYEGESPDDNPDEYYKFEYVDLGLPSGRKWAACNVGASRPEEVGSYFAWGETSPKEDYSYSNSAMYNVAYTTLLSEGAVNSNGILTPEYDAARQNLGEGWRMPTAADYLELIANCSRSESMINGISCLTFTGPNGKSISMPCSGFINGGAINVSYSFLYWSSTMESIDGQRAYRFFRIPYNSQIGCGSDNRYFNFSTNYTPYRYYGMPIRAVHE